MTTPKIYKTEAIVLKRSRLGEADSLLTLYTPYLGKIRAVAKGALRPKSKLGGHVELLSHSQMLLARGQNLDIVSQCQTLDSFLPLRDDLWRISCAVYLAELVDRFTEEHLENYPLFRLLLDSLRWLCWARDGGLVLRYFEIHLCHHLGYRPELGRCLGCGAPLQPRPSFFSPASGGVLCPRCGPGLARPLSLNALKVLRYLQRSSPAAASKLKLTPELSAEVEGVLRGYLRYLLEREVKSAAWLDELRRESIQQTVSTS
ncbi:MAG TPA: DNA repair protein RecO [Dehalococcoidia bacterium]|nr:DNA repair protein RecO [Dehalococcoidia bacterium]